VEAHTEQPTVPDDLWEALLPPLSPEEEDALRTDIAAHGVRVPVVLDAQGRIVDGRHRLKIARELGIPYPVEILPPDATPLQKLRLALSLNLKRRHLTREQKQAIAWRLRAQGLSYPQIAAMMGVDEKTVRLWLSGSENSDPESPPQVQGRDGKDYPSERPSPVEIATRREAVARLRAAGHTIPQIASTLGVSVGTVAADLKATRLFFATPTQAQQALARLADLETLPPGTYTSPADLTAVAYKAMRARLAARGETAPLPDSITLRCGDFREVLADLPADSVPLIFTDPPYDRASLPLYGDLARFAARVLCDGGSLLCYGGHYALPDILRHVLEGGGGALRFFWLIAIVHGGASARMHVQGVYVGWKPLLWFVKGERRRDDRGVRDCFAGGGAEKTYHDWAQGLQEARYYIAHLTRPGEPVVDPFAGSGTTLLAALLEGRRALGAERDPQTFRVALARLADHARTTRPVADHESS
jgi:ParB-like chromosome segregation protein Spo0J/16S rRNA G966 N2-methylase RsmD